MTMAPDVISVVLMTLLLVVALSICFIKDLLWAVILFGAYSLVMTLVWQQLNAPDIAITEAAAGIGMAAIMVAVIMRTGRDER